MVDPALLVSVRVYFMNNSRLYSLAETVYIYFELLVGVRIERRSAR